MITAQEIFDAAMALMDEGGSLSDVAEYKKRALPLLNTLRGELARCCAVGGGTCPRLNAMSDAIELDERLCRTALPYGLAAALLLGERNEDAAFFQTRYDRLIAAERASAAAEFEDIGELYGGIDLQRGRW